MILPIIRRRMPSGIYFVKHREVSVRNVKHLPVETPAAAPHHCIQQISFLVILYLKEIET